MFMIRKLVSIWREQILPDSTWDTDKNHRNSVKYRQYKSQYSNRVPANKSMATPACLVSVFAELCILIQIMLYRTTTFRSFCFQPFVIRFTNAFDRFSVTIQSDALRVHLSLLKWEVRNCNCAVSNTLATALINTDLKIMGLV